MLDESDSVPGRNGYSVFLAVEWKSAAGLTGSPVLWILGAPSCWVKVAELEAV
jgi:hypothetical protein